MFFLLNAILYFTPWIPVLTFESFYFLLNPCSFPWIPSELGPGTDTFSSFWIHSHPVELFPFLFFHYFFPFSFCIPSRGIVLISFCYFSYPCIPSLCSANFYFSRDCFLPFIFLIPILSYPLDPFCLFCPLFHNLPSFPTLLPPHNPPPPTTLRLPWFNWLGIDRTSPYP